AGWAGVFLAFVPAMILWSNTVMLNMPAAALGLGLLFHVRRWQEGGGSAQLILAAACLSAVALTYYPGAAAACVCVAWTLWLRGDGRLDRRALVAAGVSLLALAPLTIALVLMPIHTARQWPTI